MKNKLINIFIFSLLAMSSLQANQITTNHQEKHLISEGVRLKFGFIKVYEIKLFANNLCTNEIKSEKNISNDKTLISPKHSWKIQMTLLRDLDFNTIRDAILGALEDRLDDKNKKQLTEQFSAFFTSDLSLLENDVIIFDTKNSSGEEASLSVLFVKDNIYKTIKSDNFVKAFFAIYLDNNAVISEIREEVNHKINSHCTN